MNIEEIYNKLRLQEGVELLDMLYITSDDIIERFKDRISERLETLNIEVEE